MIEPLPSLNDPRVQAVWRALQAEGWIINSLKQAQVAVAALDAMNTTDAARTNRRVADDFSTS